MRVIKTTDPRAITHSKSIVNVGGLIAFPTDTVYGLGVDAFNSEAIEKIYIAKGRSAEKAIAILIGHLSQLEKVTGSSSRITQLLMQAFWPGALTIIVKKHPDLPEIISPRPTIGIRMPDHPFTLSLLTKTGPLATTSANISGSPDSRTAEDVEKQLGGKIDLLLDGGECPGGIPSTVVDCTGERPVILRQGNISEKEISSAIE